VNRVCSSGAVWMIAMALSVAMVAVAGLAATAESKVMRWPPMPDCKDRGGWIIRSDRPPLGGIAIHECGNRTVVALEQLHESGGDRHATIRDTLELSQIGLPIVPCRADGTLAFSDIVVVAEFLDGHLKPTFSRAWKADTETWEFLELDPAAVECTLWPPIGD
jgi:hypothetical protein